MSNQPIKKTNRQDDQYKQSIKPFVDEAMEAHNLAPAIKTAITENKPLNDELQRVIVEAVQRNPDVKSALDKVVSENEAIKKSRAQWKQPTFWIPLLITAVLGIISIIVSVIALNR